LLFCGGVQHWLAGLVIFAGNLGKYPELAGGQLAVGHGDPQHGRVALHIPAVLQAQRAKFGITEFAVQVARELVTVLGGALADELAVKGGVLVHGGSQR
jgi:hypothetical protein